MLECRLHLVPRPYLRHFSSHLAFIRLVQHQTTAERPHPTPELPPLQNQRAWKASSLAV